MTIGINTTPMHSWHKSQGANMADFAGFDMPLWYPPGVKKEHLAVLQSAGVFDTSHMAGISVIGQDAFKLLDICFTRNLSQLESMRCTYGAFLDTKGHCIDDAIVYKFNTQTFMVCVNAGMGAAIAGHLEKNRDKKQKGLNVIVKDLSTKIAKIDIQGPHSAKILSRLIQDADIIFSTFSYFSFKGYFDENLSGPSAIKLKNGVPILLSRSGYTGEFGFEIFLLPNAALELWENILASGSDLGCIACGLGARDSLRTGAGLPLSHKDIGNFKFSHHPWQFALPYNTEKTAFTKSFIGDSALLEDKDIFYTLPFVGDSLRKIGTGDQTKILDHNKNEIGHVLSCATDMAIDWDNDQIVSINSPQVSKEFKIKGLSCGFVRVSENLAPGTRITLQENKRSITARIVKTIRPDMTARKKIINFI